MFPNINNMDLFKYPKNGSKFLYMQKFGINNMYNLGRKDVYGNIRCDADRYNTCHSEPWERDKPYNVHEPDNDSRSCVHDNYRPAAPAPAPYYNDCRRDPRNNDCRSYDHDSDCSIACHANDCRSYPDYNNRRSHLHDSDCLAVPEPHYNDRRFYPDDNNCPAGTHYNDRRYYPDDNDSSPAPHDNDRRSYQHNNDRHSNQHDNPCNHKQHDDPWNHKQHDDPWNHQQHDDPWNHQQHDNPCNRKQHNIDCPDPCTRVPGPCVIIPGAPGPLTIVPGAKGPVSIVPGAGGPCVIIPGAPGPVSIVPGAPGSCVIVPGAQGPGGLHNNECSAYPCHRDHVIQDDELKIIDMITDSLDDKHDHVHSHHSGCPKHKNPKICTHECNNKKKDHTSGNPCSHVAREEAHDPEKNEKAHNPDPAITCPVSIVPEAKGPKDDEQCEPDNVWIKGSICGCETCHSEPCDDNNKSVIIYW
jgi:hypothetical protein